MEHLHTIHSDVMKPERFTYPFCYEPHPLCQLAAKEVQAYIAAHPEIREDADRGKMFGVLVVEAPQNPQIPQNPQHPQNSPHRREEIGCATNEGSELFFLAAYSGLLAGRNDWDFFVPPVFDAQQPDGYFKQQEHKISEIVRTNENDDEHCSKLKTQNPKLLSQELQLWLFHQYKMLNARGEVKDLVDIWQDYYSRPKLRSKFPLPPGGTGDCCAPKLLQYAYQQGLKPVCMAEFWWGAATKTELRQHLNYYPACRGKCKPILTWMLQGLEVDPDPESLGLAHLDIPIVYEDEWLLVVNKPSGMLSTPGRIDQYSVETVMQQRYPGSVIAHRLDMGTSGLLIVAKSQEVYRQLQEQFVKHQVKKKYLAILTPKVPLSSPEGDTNVMLKSIEVPSGAIGEASRAAGAGRISLPLRPDPMNRPRQVVDMEHGKQAITDYEFITDDLIALYPHTGRTHQLRIHCAHPDGLGRPIVGDELYGNKGKRLMLHAAEIWFKHPITGQEMHFKQPFSAFF